MSRQDNIKKIDILVLNEEFIYGDDTQYHGPLVPELYIIQHSVKETFFLFQSVELILRS